MERTSRNCFGLSHLQSEQLDQTQTAEIFCQCTQKRASQRGPERKEILTNFGASSVSNGNLCYEKSSPQYVHAPAILTVWRGTLVVLCYLRSGTPFSTQSCPLSGRHNTPDDDPRPQRSSYLTCLSSFLGKKLTVRWFWIFHKLSVGSWLSGHAWHLREYDRCSRWKTVW